MSIKASLSSDGLEEVYTPPTLKEMCLYKCLTNKDILTKEVEVDEGTNGTEKLDWEKFRLKEPIQNDLVEALLNAGDEYLFMLTPKYEPVLAAIRMSQPEHLVKVHVINAFSLKDWQLEFLLSGGNVKSLDIHGCYSLMSATLDAINTFGRKLEYLRIGDFSRVLPAASTFEENSAILKTPNLKTFIISHIYCYEATKMTNYWRFLLQDFISNLEDLQISRIQDFESLGFLEQAKNKLTSLTLSNCVVAKNANAWAALFNLDKLKSLNLVSSSIGEAFVGENVVQRLLIAMPNLTHLAVDSGLVKTIYVDTPIRGQGSMAKRLEFLVVMDNDAGNLQKAKLLASEVACLGTFEGELRILEYFSNRLNFTCRDRTLERLLDSLSLVRLPWKRVAVIRSLMKTVKNNSISVIHRNLFLRILKQLLTADVVAKLGEVLLDQCIESIFAFMRGWSRGHVIPGPEIIRDIIDIMMILDAKLCFDHYATLVSMVMRMAEMATRSSFLYHPEWMEMEVFKGMLKSIGQLLEKAVERFQGETNVLWGISSVLFVIKKYNERMMTFDEGYTAYLLRIFSSMIASLRKLCLNSGPRRAAFHSAGGVEIVMDLLKRIIEDRLGLADRDSLALMEILKIIMQDANLNLSESGVIALGLEKLLLLVHSQWEFLKSSNSVGETTHYSHLQVQTMVSLLSYLESDLRYDYKASAAVNEIMMKFK